MNDEARLRVQIPHNLIDLSTPPSTVRECLAQGLGPYRSLPRRGDMTVAHARHLIETYPTLYRHADSPNVGSFRSRSTAHCWAKSCASSPTP